MRVVSLLPAATEMVAALGALEHLIGITHECDFPPVVGSRARVTSSMVEGGDDAGAVDRAVRERSARGEPMFTLHARRIAALHPELILTQAVCDVCAVKEADVRELAATLSPPPSVVTLGGLTLDGVLEDVVRVAAALGVPDEGQELLAGFRARLRAVHGALQEAQAPRPRAAIIEWTDPLFPAGHWAPEMIRRAGGADVLGTPGARSAPLTMAAVRDADPEIVVIAPCGYGLARAEATARTLRTSGEWEWLETRQLWAMDANGLVSRPGPRLIDGIEVLARIFHPSLFSALDDSHAVRVA